MNHSLPALQPCLCTRHVNHLRERSEAIECKRDIIVAVFGVIKTHFTWFWHRTLPLGKNQLFARIFRSLRLLQRIPIFKLDWLVRNRRLAKNFMNALSAQMAKICHLKAGMHSNDSNALFLFNVTLALSLRRNCKSDQTTKKCRFSYVACSAETITSLIKVTHIHKTLFHWKNLQRNYKKRSNILLCDIFFILFISV